MWNLKRASCIEDVVFSGTVKTQLEIQNCGIFLHKNYSYTVASPDGIPNSKYYGKTLIEIKCPFNIRNKTIQEGIHECLFLVEKDGVLTLSSTPKLYHKWE